MPASILKNQQIKSLFSSLQAHFALNVCAFVERNSSKRPTNLFDDSLRCSSFQRRVNLWTKSSKTNQKTQNIIFLLYILPPAEYKVFFGNPHIIPPMQFVKKICE